jgi:16S rRNA (guanine(966)-N(2))-methyltransferase RsmD
MRIVAGHFRSRNLLSAKGLDLRPTSDRLRETLFNILGARVEGSTFLDVCAGTGAVGIEALSRGAAHVILIEKHAATAALIQRNLLALNVRLATPKIESPDQDPEAIGVAEVIHAAAGTAFAKLTTRGIRASLIFADPPYAEKKLLDAIIRSVADSEILTSQGIFIAEHPSRVSLPESEGKLRRTRVLTQGDSTLSFFGFQS